MKKRDSQGRPISGYLWICGIFGREGEYVEPTEGRSVEDFKRRHAPAHPGLDIDFRVAPMVKRR